MDILLTDSLVTSLSAGFLDDTTVQTLVVKWYGMSRKVEENGPFPSVENGSKTIYHRRRQIHRAEAVSILGSPSLPLPRALVGATDNADLVWFGAAGWRWWWRAATAAANTDCPYLLVCSHCGCPLDPKEIGIYFDASGRKRMRS